MEQNRDRKGAARATYFITFVCYGQWIPGEERTVDRDHNMFGGRFPEESGARVVHARTQMVSAPYLLDEVRRPIVMESIKEVCGFRGWNLLAAHVRTTHVHVVVDADSAPEQVMNCFKSYASRALNRIEPDCKRWAWHGSTRYLWNRDSVSAAIHYVVCEQGDPMEVFS